MEQVNVTISLDKNIKEYAESLLKRTGLSWTNLLEEAIALREPQGDSLEALKEVEEMIKTGDYGKTYDDVDLMMKEILR